jgi:hypothetical protein
MISSRALVGKSASESARPPALDARGLSSSRPPPRVRGGPGENADARALLDEVQRACTSLEALVAHGEQLGALAVADVRTRVLDIQRKLDRDTICAVLIGDDKPRRITFMNALLGESLFAAEARTPGKIVSLRTGPKRHYLARGERHAFDFDKLHPDRAPELVHKIADNERKLHEATALRDAQAREVETHRYAAEHAFGELKDKFNAFETARSEAEGMAAEITQRETERTELARAGGEQERALPRVLRAAPPGWAIWLWIAYAVARLVWSKAYRAWQARLAVIADVDTEVGRLRISASNAALACRVAEAALDPLALPAESSRSGFVEARKRLAELDTRIQRLGRDLAATQKELERRQSDRIQQFHEDVSGFYEDDAEDVTSLELRYPAQHLPEELTVLDVTSAFSRGAQAEERAWALVAERADACVFVSDLDATLPDATKSRILRALALMPHVVLVLTGMDDVYLESLRDPTSTAAQRLERLRDVAGHRFAGELSCAEQHLPLLSLPASATLEEGVPAELLRRFDAEVKRLSQVVRLERSLLLGARVTSAVHEWQSGMREAEQRVERYYEQQITILEERQRPDPERFRSEQISAAAPSIQAAAADITHAALQALRTRINGLRAQIVERVLACQSPQQLTHAAAELERWIRRGLERSGTEIGREIELRADAAVRSIELGVFEALRLRYEIGFLVTRASSPSLHIDDAPTTARAAASLQPSFERVARRFWVTRGAIGFAGALIGATLAGSVLGLAGVALGALAGTLLLFAWTFGQAQRQCLRAVDASLLEPEAALAAQVRGSETVLIDAIGRGLDASVSRAMARYEQWILEPLDADRTAIAHYGERLRDLRALRDRLLDHQKRLAWLSQAVSSSMSATLRR